MVIYDSEALDFEARHASQASSDEIEDMLSVRYVSEERRKSPLDIVTGEAMVIELRLLVADADVGGEAKVS